MAVNDSVPWCSPFCESSSLKRRLHLVIHLQQMECDRSNDTTSRLSFKKTGLHLGCVHSLAHALSLSPSVLREASFHIMYEVIQKIHREAHIPRNQRLQLQMACEEPHPASNHVRLKVNSSAQLCFEMTTAPADSLTATLWETLTQLSCLSF